MKILFFFIAFSQISLFAQERSGFETLGYFKNALDGPVRTFIINIPDTSRTFKKYAPLINKQYSLAKAEYEGYRGRMENCLRRMNTFKKIRQCLGTPGPKLELSVDSLYSLLDEAKLEIYLEAGVHIDKTMYGTTNVSNITPDQVTSLVTSLVDAAIKIFNEKNKMKNELRNDFINSIRKKEYDLTDFWEIVSSLKKK